MRSILALGVAPYVMSSGIASGVLMPVKKLWTPADGFDGLEAQMIDINIPVTAYWVGQGLTRFDEIR